MVLITWELRGKDDAMPESILLLQDSARKTAIVQELLAHSVEGPFVIEWIRSCGAALDRLGDHAKDDITAVIIDLLLSDGQELEILDQIIQASPTFRSWCWLIRSTRTSCQASHPTWSPGLHLQFLKLQAQQCAEGQGYYFQAPVAGDEFAKLLKSDLSTPVLA